MSTAVVVDTAHTDVIHDSQFDYYGKRLATCSSDKSIRVFSVVENAAPTKVAEFNAHNGPVWQLSWSHPKFGSLLASCSYDRKVAVWKEQTAGGNDWRCVYEYTGHTQSVNSVAFAPHELGLILACGSSDGTISIHQHIKDEQWEVIKFSGHAKGVNCVCWSSAIFAGALLSSSSISSNTNTSAPIVKMLASAGCDCLIKIWTFNEGEKISVAGDPEILSEHVDWVRDVAFAPNIGLATNTLASCSQDGTVLLWSKTPSSKWTSKPLPKFAEAVWRLSWSVTGSILAVAGGDNKVTLWKENVEGEWKLVSTLDEH